MSKAGEENAMRLAVKFSEVSVSSAYFLGAAVSVDTIGTSGALSALGKERREMASALTSDTWSLALVTISPALIT